MAPVLLISCTRVGRDIRRQAGHFLLSGPFQEGLLMFLLCSRLRTHPVAANTRSKPSPPKTTPSPRTRTVNTSTASATRAGPRTPRKSPSTSMELSTCPSRRCRRLRWKPKVGLECFFRLCNRAITDNLPVVRRLSEMLAQVKDEQSYIVVRERVHRNTAESTNTRVKWWSIFQLAVLIGEGIFQVWWLKRFFEVRYLPGT